MNEQALGVGEGQANGLRTFIWTATLAKLLINTSKRMIYPFAPAIARGLGVNIGQVTSIIAMNQAASIFSPFIVVLADRFGHRILLLVSFMFFCLAMFAAGLIPLYSVVMLAFLIAGLAKSIIDPVLQAVAGNMVSYERRGRIIGIIETAWAGSTLVGLPLTGVIIEKLGWQTPFLIYGVLTLGILFLLLGAFPKRKVPSSESTAGQKGLIDTWKTIIKQPRVLLVFIFNFFMCMANDNLFVVYGVWLEDGFGMGLAAIGLGTVFIGLSEISGEMLTVSLADRIGLKKAMVYGAIATCAGYFLLVPAAVSLSGVLCALFLVFLAFEFTIVTSLSFATELVPQFRATTMSLYFAAAGVGRVVGAVTGGMLWTRFGIAGVCVVSGTATALGVLALMLCGHKNPPDSRKKACQGD